MRALKVALVVATVAGAAPVADAGAAPAMPIGGRVAASSELAGDVLNVRWCGRSRCGWRPRVYFYPPVVHAYPSVYYSPYYSYYGSPYYRPYWDW